MRAPARCRQISAWHRDDDVDVAWFRRRSPGERHVCRHRNFLHVTCLSKETRGEAGPNMSHLPSAARACPPRYYDTRARAFWQLVGWFDWLLPPKMKPSFNGFLSKIGLGEEWRFLNPFLSSSLWWAPWPRLWRGQGTLWWKWVLSRRTMTRSEASLPPNRIDPGRGALDSMSRARRHVRVPGRRCPRFWVERSPMESNRPTRKRLLTANSSVSQTFFLNANETDVSKYICWRNFILNVLNFDATVLLN